VSRYYYQKGRAEHRFKDDQFINKSIDVLQNSKEYNTILGN